MSTEKTCIHCGRQLTRDKGVWICRRCNSRDLEYSGIFIDEKEDDGYVFIECPGATLYREGTNEVAAGVRFHDDDDPSRGYEIVDHPVYAPTHTKKRRIKREALGRFGAARGVRTIRCGCAARRGRTSLCPHTSIPDERN